MQDIYIDKVQLKNVRGVLETEMDFPLDNFTIITGKIGAGKSTIFKAISFALYGTDGGLPGESSTINDLINKKTQKNLEIILDFRIEDEKNKDKYQIQLYANHSKHHNKFFLIKNTEDISQKTKGDTYNYIETLLIPKNVFFNTIYFGQQIKNFFTSLTNSEQKQIFDSIISLKEYNEYYKKNDEVRNQIQEKFNKIEHQLNISNVEIQQKDEFLKTLFSNKEKELNQKKIKISELRCEKEKKENEIECLETEKNEIVFNQEELDNLIEKNSIIKSEIENINSDFLTEKKQIENNFRITEKDKLSILQNQCNEEKNSLNQSYYLHKSEIESEINSIDKIIFDIIKKYDISELEKSQNGFEKEKQRETSFLFNEIENINKKFSTNEYEQEKKNRLNSLNNQLDEIKIKAEPVQSEAQKIKNDKEKLENENKEDEESISAEISICSKCKQPLNQKHISELKIEIERKKGEIEILDKKIIDYKNQFDEFKTDVLQIKTLLLEEEKKYNDLINNLLEKKKEELHFNERKRELIQNEIKEVKNKTDNDILSLKQKQKEESSSFEKKKDSLSTKIILIKKELDSSISDSISKLEKDMLNVKDEYNKMVSESLNSLNKEIEEKKISKNKIFNDNVDKIRTIKETKLKIDSFDDRIQEFRILIENLKVQIKSEQDFVFDESEIDKIQKQIKELQDKKIVTELEISSIKEELEILKFWKEAFSDSGIKSMLIDSAIPHMNDCMRNELELLCPGVFTVTFDTLKMTKSGDLKDKFNVNIRHNLQGTDNHKMLSGGEKRLIDLCCMRSLRSLSERLYDKRFHNTFYDEVLDSLDSDSCNMFCQVIRYLSKNQNVSLITHNEPDNMEPDRVFRF